MTEAVELLVEQLVDAIDPAPADLVERVLVALANEHTRLSA